MSLTRPVPLALAARRSLSVAERPAAPIIPCAIGTHVGEECQVAPVALPSTPETTLPAVAAPAPQAVPALRPADGWLAEARATAQTRADFDAQYPLRGLAFHVLAQIFVRPSVDAAVAGYMRRGARFRAAEGITGGGCRRTWHRLSTGGFVCRGRGFLVGRSPPAFQHATAPPRLTDRLPYPYLKTVGRDVPQYWHVPTPAEEALARAAVAEIGQSRAAQDEQPSGSEATEVENQTQGELQAPPQAGRDERLPDYVRMAMQRGFYISQDTTPTAPPQSAPDAASQRSAHFVRSVRGAYVRADALVPAKNPSLHGHALRGKLRLPVGLVYFGTTQPMRRDPLSGDFRPQHELKRFAATGLMGQTEQIGQFAYQLTTAGNWIQTRSMRIARKRSRPALVPREARWLHIDRAEQVLVAYQGDSPIFATLVSTGKEGFETPAGIFRIQAKHVATTMDGSAAGEEAYSIEDVPWTMYFKGSYALHAAFWHQRFGRVRSHGCINLAPADAQYLFEWTTPGLPAAWHGVLVQPRAPSTYVQID